MIRITDRRQIDIAVAVERRKLDDCKVEAAFLRLHLKTALVGLVVSWIPFVLEAAK